MPDQLRPDWHRVFEDFVYLGVAGAELAGKVGLLAGELQSVATGRVEPTPLAAARIQRLWVSLTGKPAEFLPLATRGPRSLQPDVPGLDEDGDQASAFAQRRARDGDWLMLTMLSLGEKR